MAQEISADLIRPLADAIGDAFEMPELDGIVLRCTGARLFKEWVPTGTPERVTAYNLLLALQEPGLVGLFLANVLVAKPENTALGQLIAKAWPEAVNAQIEVRKQVPAVLAGLVTTQSKLADPAVKQALTTLRDSLAIVVRDIETLEIYKNLHDCLHSMQMKSFASLRLIAKQLTTDTLHIGDLREYEEQLRTSYTRARDWADRLPDGPTVKPIEMLWIDELEAATNIFQPAIDTSDARSALLALNRVRQVVRTQPFQLNKQIYVTAKNLPLQNLTVALLTLSGVVAGPEHAEMAAAYVSMRDLHATLLGRVAEHKLWQEADNSIWDLDETFRYGSEATREEFNMLWSDVKPTILALADLDPKAKWSQNTRQYSVHVDDQLAREEQDNGLANAFDAYRRELRFHFFAVDGQLRSDCAALVKIGAPLHTILEDLGHD